MNETSFIRKVPKKTLQLICFLWAAWIFGSSCTVITRKQFVSTASTATRMNEGAVSNVWESFWWVFVKGYHVLEYTILTLLLIGAFASFKKNPLIAGFASLAYAATDEWHQTFVPHRGGHVSDVMIDSLGITIAVVLIVGLRARRKRGTKGTTS